MAALLAWVVVVTTTVALSTQPQSHSAVSRLRLAELADAAAAAAAVVAF